jgi:predicted nucleic acid-binding protein
MNCMSDRCFVDTNILIYAHDRTAGMKHTRAKALVKELWHSRMGVLSTQVLQEFCANVRKKTSASLPIEEVRALVEDYLTWDIVQNLPTSIPKALDLEMRYRISFWDALIIHAAQEAGASVLYSEDLSDGQHYGTVQVINPLTDSFAVPS